MNSSITLCPKNLISQGIQENGMRNNMTNFIDEDNKINNEKNNLQNLDLKKIYLDISRLDLSSEIIDEYPALRGIINIYLLNHHKKY